jgi:hypothetical protein
LVWPGSTRISQNKRKQKEMGKQYISITRNLDFISCYLYEKHEC